MDAKGSLQTYRRIFRMQLMVALFIALLLVLIGIYFVLAGT